MFIKVTIKKVKLLNEPLTTKLKVLGFKGYSISLTGTLTRIFLIKLAGQICINMSKKSGCCSALTFEFI